MELLCKATGLDLLCKATGLQLRCKATGLERLYKATGLYKVEVSKQDLRLDLHPCQAEVSKHPLEPDLAYKQDLEVELLCKATVIQQDLVNYYATRQCTWYHRSELLCEATGRNYYGSSGNAAGTGGKYV